MLGNVAFRHCDQEVPSKGDFLGKAPEYPHGGFPLYTPNQVSASEFWQLPWGREFIRIAAKDCVCFLGE